MGAKLSRAKRPKRRWIGLSIHPSITSRTSLESRLNKIRDQFDRAIKLFDFFRTEDELSSNLAIVCIDLEHYQPFLKYLEDQEESQITSITTSGKIRLVRERLGLDKPKRYKHKK